MTPVTEPSDPQRTDNPTGLEPPSSGISLEQTVSIIQRKTKRRLGNRSPKEKKAYVSVSDTSGCCNKMPHTGGLKGTNYFLISHRAKKIQSNQGKGKFAS